MLRKWSSEQQGAIDEIAFGQGHVQIESVAGSGKTSVIVAGCHEIPRGVKAIVVAFNKSIATELEARLKGSGVVSGTFHSVCFSFIKSRVGKVKVDAQKCYKLLNKKYPEMYEARMEVVRLVGLMKNNGVGLLIPNSVEIVEELRENYDITHEKFSPIEIVNAARAVFKLSKQDIGNIDFDDMIYLALSFIVERGWQMDKWDVVIVDEFQDMNEVQLSILEVMGDRIIGVGDRAQGIYGFRGAGTDTMNIARERWNMKEVPMTVTWRCPLKVVQHANQWVPQLQAREGAPDGIVEWTEYDGIWQLLRPEDCMVICRNNFPLFKVAMKLLLEKKSFNMPGNFPKKLIGFVKHFKADNIQQFRVRLQEWWEAKRTELMEKKKFGALEREEDKYLSLMALQKECISVQELEQKLNDMMRSSYGPLLTTVHGAKGLEAERVIVLMPELMPSKYAQSDSELQQEENLMYVAATRAGLELYYVSGEHG